MLQTVLSAAPWAVILLFFAGATFARWSRDEVARMRSAVRSSIAALTVAGSAFLARLFVLTADTERGQTWLSFDALNAVMLLLVSFVGFVVVRYSVRYLDGNPRQHVFFSNLCTTLGLVSGLVCSADLLVLCFFWIGTSMSLHRLLLFYGQRPRAQMAARKKFLSARLGDVALITATVLLAKSFGTTSIPAILDASRTLLSAGAVPSDVTGAAFLLVAAAALKSAQFPTHGWLTEVMETPTPVSALLHAGIVNAGGFLLIRFADVLVLAPSAMMVLIVVGGLTALLGSVIMLTQTSVKVALAYSTVAQMGFMLLQCGFGVFSAATLHLMAHSLYKAHAFLSSGRAVTSIKGRKEASSPSVRDLLKAFGAGLGIYVVLALLFAPILPKSLAILALGIIFVLGTVVHMAGSSHSVHGFRRAIFLAGGASLFYFCLQAAAFHYFGALLRSELMISPLMGVLLSSVVLAFLAVALFQVWIPQLGQRAWMRGLYVHLSRGLYANTLSERLITVFSRRSTYE